MWRKSDPDGDLEREITDHLQLDAEERVAGGTPPDQARAEARRVFGSSALAMEDTRTVWGRLWIERAEQDLRFGARLLLKSPGFSVAAVLTLAVGIGASTAIFSQVNALFWKPLPVENPTDLRTIVWSSRRPTFVAMPNVMPGPQLSSGATYGSFSYPAYESMRDGASNTIDLACWADLGETRPVVMREVGFGTVHFVSGNYFDVIGVRAAVGRVLTLSDDVPGTTAAVISYPFWQRTYGGDRSVVNRTIDLNGKAFSIVGVTPAGFFGVDPSTLPDVLVPINAIQLAAATSNPLRNHAIWSVCRVFGRIRPDTDNEAARAATERWLGEAIRADPPHEAYEMPHVLLLDGAQGSSLARDAIVMPMVLLLSVVLAILLVACANIAGLLIVRGAARQREIATRLALGASRARVIRQLLTESLLLSTLGGVIGVGLAYGSSRMSAAFVSRLMPTLFGANRQLGVVIGLDSRVLAFALALTVASGVFFGLLPAARATRLDLIGAIKQQPGWRWGTIITADRAMVALQAAVCLALVFGALLLIQTLENLRAEPLGFDPNGVLFAKVEPRTGGIPTNRRGDYIEEAVRRLSETPGIVAASATDGPPLTPPATIFQPLSFAFCTPSYVPATPQESTADVTNATPGLFTTLKIPVIAGRDFSWADRPRGADIPQVVIINEAFARRFFGRKDPLERRIGYNCPASPTALRVVGIVGDIRTGARDAVVPRVYVPLANAQNVITLVTRTSDPQRAVATIRRTMAALNVDVPTFDEVPAVVLREQQLRQERLLTDLLLAFGAIAIVLAAIGIYGMLAFLVVRRTREIGIRIAVGASRADVVRLVAKEALIPLVLGLSAGAALSLVAAPYGDRLLFGVSDHDLGSLATATIVMVAIALVATAMPASRATRLDPVSALRVE